MKRIMLVIAYDGTKYCGWQIQPNGITIEEIINRELTTLLKEPITVIGASRTDSGVHALGNVAVFDSETKIPGEKISYALNQRLPKDIVVRKSMDVPLDFHPRYCNSTKTYEYKILNTKFPIPTNRLYSHFVYYPLNLDNMIEASKYLVGEHDFKSFCSTRTQVLDTVRTIYNLNIDKQDDMISITISGNGFLYNMVRIIVGTLIKVGLGVYPPDHVCEILEKKDRTAAGPKAPAEGLMLHHIDYPDLVVHK
ncbi:MAG: pseudouridylate synthase [Anaerocolumna sp.]|jgi:tRNA pseudouridine38-40 synthase|nr:pseudouridylate synthase [Anaerocolumna sp.]